jgi:hypothetical protein
MASQETFNSQRSVDNALAHLLIMILPQGRWCHALRLHCHLNDCRVPFAKASEQFFTENESVHVLHLPHRPDLAPSEFWLCVHMKAALVGQVFDRPEELLDHSIFRGDSGERIERPLPALG